MSVADSADPHDAVLARWRERILAAGTARAPLRLRGGGTKDFYGHTPRGEVFDTREYAGIVAFDPTELVITARCGTPLGEIQSEVARAGQMLAFEPPAFGETATIGGVVAAGLSGPRRAAAGSVRDFVLGACLLDAKGQWMRFGGQVMKNVAGYDVSRLLCGSLGFLGVITEVSLKVLPRPALEATVRLAADQRQALVWFNEWAGRPLPVSATAWHDGVVTVRLSGAAAAVTAALDGFASRYGARRLDDDEAHAFWADVREHRHAAFAGPVQWRLSVPSVAPVLDLPGSPLVEWGGALRWYASDLPAERVRAAAAAVGGQACRFRGGARDTAVFHPLAPAVARVHARLKQEFDPQRLFNPGRLIPEL